MKHELVLDRRAPESLTHQLHGLLRRAILLGDLAPDSLLPSTPALSKRLRISRNTVLGAYEALALEGLIVGRRGSGTRVADGLARELPEVARPRLNSRRLLRAAHYPMQAARFRDPDGNAIYAHS
jgi:DNA-binding GntR family transcriptional regulator